MRREGRRVNTSVERVRRARTAAHERAADEERDFRVGEAPAEREDAKPREADRELPFCISMSSAATRARQCEWRTGVIDVGDAAGEKEEARECQAERADQPHSLGRAEPEVVFQYEDGREESGVVECV
jgi:hypothetical protein